MPAMKFRDATQDDLAAIVGLLADDTLGANREIAPPPVAECYVAAFRAIDADPNNRVIVAEDADYDEKYEKAAEMARAKANAMREKSESEKTREE